MTPGWVVLALAAAAAGDGAGPRRLDLTNLHGGEKLTVTFHNEHDIAPDARAALRHLLRDYRLNEEHDMDFGLFVQLTDLARQCGVPASYEVISGYRSPATNAKLRGGTCCGGAQPAHGRACDRCAPEGLSAAATS